MAWCYVLFFPGRWAGEVLACGVILGRVDEKVELCEEDPSCTGKFLDAKTWDSAKDCGSSGWTTFHERPDCSCLLSSFFFE